MEINVQLHLHPKIKPRNLLLVVDGFVIWEILKHWSCIMLLIRISNRGKSKSYMTPLVRQIKHLHYILWLMKPINILFLMPITRYILDNKVLFESILVNKQPFYEEWFDLRNYRIKIV